MVSAPEHVLFVVALIGVLGIGAQWLAWRLQQPAIVLMALAGLVAGPVLGVIRPAEIFGELLQPMVSLAVALILFDGGLNLRRSELRGISAAVRRLVLVGGPLTWAMAAAAGHWIAGLSWPVAILFGGILVVTGPTVIMPLLRQAKLQARTAAVLKWEGIVNDPIGALFAVLVYEVLVHAEAGAGWGAAAAGLAGAAAVAAAMALALGLGLAKLFRRGLVPEFLKAPIILCAVLAAFVGANMLAEESGLLAVTILGIVFGNARVASIDELRRFKEGIAILLVSGVFVLLTAMLRPEDALALSWEHAAFVGAVLFVVRPLSVWLATPGAGLTWRERLLVGWIAPRGIVAVAVSGLFAAKLSALGHADAALLVPLAFAVVFATVVAHGFSIAPLARGLGLVATTRPGVLIVGATPWSVALAGQLAALEVPVTVADRVWRALRPAREAGIDTYYGEILSEVTEHRLDLNRFEVLLAATGNDAYNALVCTDLAPELGRAKVFELEQRTSEDPQSLSFTIGGRALFAPGTDIEGLNMLLARGWEFRRTKLSDAFGLDAYLAARPDGSMTVFVLHDSGRLSFVPHGKEPGAQAGDTVVAFAPAAERNAKRDGSSRGEAFAL